MFHMMRGVEPPVVRQACALLGWPEEIVGPVSFGLVRFWASIELNRSEHERRSVLGRGAVTDRVVLADLLQDKTDTVLAVDERHEGRLAPPLRLVGCLLAGRVDDALAQASWLAGYAPRAVLTQDTGDILGLLADAAVLDQGVVLCADDGLTLLSQSGPRVDGWVFNAREWALLETVYARYLGDQLVGASGG